MKTALSLLLAACCGWAAAQEFKPYPDPKITEAQWQSYYAEVSLKHGASARDDPGGERLVMFTDAGTATNFIFTAPGHAAHPAWIARRIVQNGDDLAVRQVGYYAGNMASFAELFARYVEVTERIRRDIERQSTPGQPS